MFIAAVEGEYVLKVTGGDIEGKVIITAAKPTKQPSPYIAKVFDYMPAPGQFVNKLPEYEEGDTHSDMVQRPTNGWWVQMHGQSPLVAGVVMWYLVLTILL